MTSEQRRPEKIGSVLIRIPMKRSALQVTGVSLVTLRNEATRPVKVVDVDQTGVDLTQIDAIGPYTALRLISEIGLHMRRWPPAAFHLVAHPRAEEQSLRWPAHQLPDPILRYRAAAMLRLAAMPLGRTKTGLGAFYRRLAARIGKAQAVTATARKLAILLYRTLKGEVYRDAGADTYDAQQRPRVLRHLRHRAKTLGFDLVNRETGEVIQATVSLGVRRPTASPSQWHTGPEVNDVSGEESSPPPLRYHHGLQSVRGWKVFRRADFEGEKNATK